MTERKRPNQKSPNQKHVPTDETRKLVRRMAAAGLSKQQAAHVLGMKSQTQVTHHYDEEWTQGAAEAIFGVAGLLYRKALQGNVTAMIFYLKARAGWRDRGPVDVEDAPLEPIEEQTEAKTTEEPKKEAKVVPLWPRSSG